MTWAELHGALRGRGLIRADDALRAEAAVGAVAGIAYDSRHGRAGHSVRRAARVSTPTAARSRAQAIERGAAAIVAERPAPGRRPRALGRSSATRGSRSPCSRPPSTAIRAREMRVVGITGTNGKTTTAYLLASIFEAAGIRCGLLGTVAYRIGDARCARRRARRPKRRRCRRCCARWSIGGCGACAMEVSSHALALDRVDRHHVSRPAIFTNLTRDHLDFHGDMETYFRAKRRLFEMLPRDAPSVINLDDPRGAALADAARPARHLRDRRGRRRHARPAVVLARRAVVRRPHAARHAARPLAARRPARTSTTFSRRSAAATALDVPFDAIETGFAALDGVPGRFQVVSDAARRRHRRRRLRAHRRRAAEPARDRAAAGAGPADHRVRLRRRSRSHEAAADGRGRRRV